MQIKLIVLIACSFVIVSSHLTCFNGGIVGFGKCYHYINSLQTKEEAQRICSSINGRLFAALNGSIQKLVSEIAAIKFGEFDYWLGLEKTDRGNRWRWNDGSNVSYSNWANGYPSSSETDLCVASNVITGKWYTADCTNPRKNFICETKAIICHGCSEKVSDPDASVANVSLNKRIPFSNGVNDSEVSSVNASSQTPAFGTDSSCAPCPSCTTVPSCAPCTTLPHDASTTTSAESEDLIGLATGDHWCTHATIGLKSDANDAQNLHWSDFSLFDYQNWKNGTSPQFESNGDAYCGYMASDKWGPWDMFNCGNTYGLCAVCKKIDF